MLASGLSACVANDASSDTPSGKASPAAETPVITRWDGHPQAQGWTAASFAAVAAQDDVLAGRIPGDIATWCPGYEEASLHERRAFWVGLISLVARTESSFNPAAAGGGGRYIGLMQISPKTAQRNGCDASSAKTLKNGEANLACAVEVFSRDVARDGLVAGKGNRGFGRQWMPFRKSDKRAAMAEWTSSQAYCARG